MMSLCQRCPPLLRFAESCPLQPDLLTLPQMISSNELLSAEQITELRQESISFHSFRENLLLNENMQPFVMNIILYSMTMFEMTMVATSFLAACLPTLLSMAYLTTRKPDFCRALVFYLTAKTVFWFWNDEKWYFTNERFYVCRMDGGLLENQGLCETSFLISAFLTYAVLSSLMSMNNFICRSMMQRINFAFYGMMGGTVYIFMLHLSKQHLMQNAYNTVITSIELGIGFTIIILVTMVATNFWPIRLTSYFDSFPEEEILLNHLCLKWKIDTNLSKLEKMQQVRDKLQEVLSFKS